MQKKLWGVCALATMLTWTSLIYGFVLVGEEGVVGWSRPEELSLDIESLYNETYQSANLSEVFPGFDYRVNDGMVVVGPVDIMNDSQVAAIGEGLMFIDHENITLEDNVVAIAYHYPMNNVTSLHLVALSGENRTTLSFEEGFIIGTLKMLEELSFEDENDEDEEERIKEEFIAAILEEVEEELREILDEED